MRHRRKTKKLGRSTSNRKALLRSLLRSIMLHERISTTYGKAKEASSLTDRLITLGKRNTITSKKTAISMLGSKFLINKLFDDIAPRFANRKGGYTRVLQLMPRKGDGAKMAILELTERKIIEKPAKKKGEKQTKRPERPEGVPGRGGVPERGGVPGKIEAEMPVKPARKPGKAPPKEKEEKPHTAMPVKTAPTAAKEKLDGEKRKEKAESEKEKLKKGFFKGLRRYFRGKAM